MDYSVANRAPDVAIATVPHTIDADGRAVPVLAANPAQTYRADSYANIAAAATTVVKSGAGTLSAIVVNDPGSSVTATVYDNTAGSGTKIATIALAAGMSLQYGVAFGTGLTVVTSGACDITVVYR
jgi:hypothetical protein